MTGKELLEDLKTRGYINDITDETELQKKLSEEPITFYCGFDPTASSLHVGSLLPLIVMKKLARAGHKAIALLGTGTGIIGDPSGKSEERLLLDQESVEGNTAAIETQIQKILTTDKSQKPLIVKNGDWLKKFSFIEILRDIGKHFSVNQMIARDSVKTRLTSREQGISYTEFSYMILQALDFLVLKQNHNCMLQIGGSDQWGNIASGIDLIRRKTSEKSFGLTIPLLLTSTGKKFGKTEAGTIWLSEDRTSAYAFFQFWLNSSDEDVKNLLRLFTEIPLDNIEALISEHLKTPEKRLAQTTLAYEVTAFLHGKDKADQASKTSKALFSNDLTELRAADLTILKNDLPTKFVSTHEVEDLNISDFLYLIEACESKSAARKLIQNGGVSLNNSKIKDVATKINQANFIEGKVALIKIGKKNYRLAIIK